MDRDALAAALRQVADAVDAGEVEDVALFARVGEGRAAQLLAAVAWQRGDDDLLHCLNLGLGGILDGAAPQATRH